MQTAEILIKKQSNYYNRGDIKMSVKELISELQKVDQNLDVRILTCDDNPLNEEGISFINGLITIMTEPRSNITAVYIDCRS